MDIKKRLEAPAEFANIQVKAKPKKYKTFYGQQGTWAIKSKATIYLIATENTSPKSKGDGSFVHYLPKSLLSCQ